MNENILNENNSVENNNENSYFDDVIRRISPSIDMNFYANVSDQEGKSSTDWSEKLDDDINKKQNDIFGFTLKYLNRPNLSPKHRCFTLEGNTYLTESENDPKTVYPADFPSPVAQRAMARRSPLIVSASSEFIFPVWSLAMSNKEPTIVNNNAPKYIFANPPVFKVTYEGEGRKTNKIFLIGEEKLDQWPVDFDVTLKLVSSDDSAHFNAITDLLPDYKEIIINESDIKEEGLTATFSIKNNYKVMKKDNPLQFDEENEVVRTLMLLPKTYNVESITVKVNSWSEKNTQAKIMFLSTDLKISFSGNDISEIIVLEEKTGSVEELSFGITSNSCSVKISNNNERFIKYRDLLRTNRVIQPYVSCLKIDGDKASGAKAKLGTFYSDSWEISSESNFISCKAYDILYCLQTMPLYYKIPLLSAAPSGEITPAVQSAKTVFENIFRLINEEKQRNGIFGSDIVAVIDPSLDFVEMPSVLLGADTAWNMLQQMANFTMSNVYVDRNGTVIVEVDKIIANSASAISPVEINSDNSFSYMLPAMAKTLVNKVTVPYAERGNIGESVFEKTIDKKDFIISRDNFGNPDKIIVHISFENNFKSYSSVNIFINDMNGEDITNKAKPKISFNGMGFEIPFSEGIEKFSVKIETIEPMFKVTQSNVVQEHFFSQAQNGIKAFECDCGNLADKASAEIIASKIINAYSKGKEFITASWTGSPNLYLGDKFKSTPPKESAFKEFECLSNEFTLTGGLRQKTKARKIAA